MQEVTYPFSPITSNGLGLSYSSYEKVGSVLKEKSFGGAKLKCWPNLVTGNLVFQDRVLTIQEANFALNLRFTYNSRITEPSRAWQFSHKKFVTLPNGNNVGTLQEEDGHLTTYKQDPQNPNNYLAQESVGGTKFMRFDSRPEYNCWILHDPETGNVEYYDTNGFLTKKTDRWGRATTYKYENGQLRHIVGPTGNDYEIRYAPNAIAIYDASTSITLNTYEFDALGRLSISTAHGGYQTKYTYLNDSGLLDTVTQTDGTSISFTHDPRFGVSMIKQGNGRGALTSRITYADASQPNRAFITDGFKSQTTLRFYNNGDLADVTRQKGYNIPDEKVDVTQYTYNAVTNQLENIVLPNGGIDHRTYDPENCNLLNNHVYAEGQRTQYVYTSDFETRILLVKNEYLNPNTPLTTSYVYERVNDGINLNIFLRFVITPEGRVTEYRHDERGNIGSKRTYLKTAFPKNLITPKTSPDISFMLSWVTEQEKKKQSNAISLETYLYDPHGQVRVKTTFANVDANGNGIEDEFMGYQVIVSDLFGNLTERDVKQDAQNTSKTLQAFDGVNRLTRSVDALQNATTTEYHDDTMQVTTTYANGKVTVAHNANNGLTQLSSSSASTLDNQQQYREYEYARDTGGRIEVTTRPDGKQEYTFYDRQNRLGYSVSATGIVTQYQFDKQNRFNTAIAYANPIDMTKLQVPPPLIPPASTLISLVDKIKDPIKDHQSYTFFDKAGRKQYDVDTDNYITQYIYDNLDRRVGTIQYAAKLSDTDLNTLKSGGVINLAQDFTKDRLTRSFYDNDGLLIGKQDAAGYITQLVRDVGGRIASKVVYYTKGNLDLTLTFDQLLDVVSHGDVGVSFFEYDARGQIIARLNPNEYYTEYTYSPNGLRLTAKQYANKPTGKFPLRPEPDKDKDLLTTYEYDLLGRKIKTNAPFNRVDNIQFDVMGNIILNNSLDNSANGKTDGDSLRQTQTQYDGWSQAVNKANVYVGKLLAEANGDPVKIKAIWDTQSQRNKYDQTGLLLSTTDPLGNITYIYYDANRRPILKINANLSIEESTLDSFGKEIQNRKYANFYDVSLGALTGGFLTPDFQAKITGLQSNLDHIIVYERDKRGNVITITDAESNISKKTYNAFSQIDTELLPVNSANPTLQIQHGYDTRGNQASLTKTDLTPGSTATPIVESWEFKTPLNKQTIHTNTLGGIEEQAHDLVGNVITKKSESVVRNTYTYDFINRIVTETDAYKNTSQHTYRADHSHTVTSPTGKSVTMMNLSVFNQEVKTTDILTNSVSKTHVPDGQVHVHTDQLQKDTTQEFDLIAQKKTYTDALAVQTQFGYSPTGAVQKIANDAQSANPQAVNYTPDAFNNPTLIVDPKTIKTKQVFTKNNNLQQVVTDVGGLELTKTYGRNALGTQTQYAEGDTKNPNQYVETNLVDGFNRTYGKIVDPKAINPNGLNLQTTQKLDAANNIIWEMDEDQNITRHYFTKLSQHRFTVTPEGGLKERFYDNDLRLKYERVYCNGVTVDDSTTLEQLEQLAAQAASTQDALLYYFYDEDGNEAYRVNSLGAVAHSIFNAANPPKVIQTISYSNKIDPTTLNPNLTTAQLAALIQPDPAKDRNKYYIRDAKGQAARIVDGEGYVVGYEFNDVGKPIVITKYANKVSDPNQIPVLNPDNDRKVYIVYDNLNRKIAEVETFDVDNANGRVTKFGYDQNNNPTQTCKFAGKFTIPTTYDALVTALNALVPDPSKDDIDTQGFDNANRLYLKTDGLGFMEHYEINSINLTKMRTDKMGNQWHADYDGAKRQTLATDPEVAVFDVNRAADGSLSLGNLQKIAVQTKTEYYGSGLPKTVTAGVNTQNPRKVTSTYNKNKQLESVQTEGVPVDDGTKPASFATLPITTKTLEKKTVSNVRNQKVAERDERGLWTFTVYDSEGQEVYKILDTNVVHQQVRNAFGEIENTIIYNQPIDFDLTPYQETGVPLDVVQQAMANKLSDPLNRAVQSGRDRNGNLTKQMTVGEVLYATIVNNQKVIDKMSPESNFGYNAFGELTYTGKLQSPGQLSEEFKWYNKAGKDLAVCNTNGRVDLYGYTNPFHDYAGLIQWGGALKQKPDQTTTYRQLLSYYQADPKVADRFHVIEYNIRGKVTGRGRSNIIVQALMLDNPQLGNYLQDFPPQTIMTRFILNALDNIVATVDIEGGMACQYYDARQTKIAETALPRRRLDGNKSIPLTFYFTNAFKEEVGRQKFESGAATSQPTLLPPQPIVVNPDKDQLTLKFLDIARGHPLVVQDGDSNLAGFAVNETGNIVRNFHWLTNKDHPSNPQPLLQMMETRFGFDAHPKPISQTQLVDGVVKLVTLAQYNSFNENIAQGFVNPQGQPEYFEFTDWDVTGHSWRHNRKGIPTITIRNLCGHIGLQLTSMTQDLRQVQYADIPNLVRTAKMEDLMQAWIVRDSANREMQRYLPEFSENDPNQFKNIPLSMVVGKQYPDMGTVSLSWEHPSVPIIDPRMTIWPASNPDFKALVTIKKSYTRFGVDLSALPTDVYQYEIEDHLIGNDQRVLFQTIGTFQCDTGIVQGSTRLVVEVQNGSTLFLTGNTTNLTAIKLLKNGVQVGQDIPVPANHLIDLSVYQSDVYTVQPVVTAQDNLPQSLPFTIFTNTLSEKPLALELDSTFSLKYLSNSKMRKPSDPRKYYFELDWTVSDERYDNSVIEVSFEYIVEGTQNPQKSNVFAITHQTNEGKVYDEKGNAVNVNMVLDLEPNSPLPVPPITIKSLTIILVLDGNIRVPICNGYPFQNSSGGSGVTIINSLSFRPTTIIYFAPITQFDQLPAMQYFDTSSGVAGTWTVIDPIAKTAQGIVVDATLLLPGNYPFKMAKTLLELQERSLQDESRRLLAEFEGKTADPEIDGIFTIGQGSMVFTSVPVLTILTSKKPVRAMEHDNFDNISKVTDTYGYSTDNQFDARGKLVETEHPEVEVELSNGATVKMRPVTKWGYDIRGHKIGVRDGNNHTRGWIVDEIGQVIKSVLADGTISEQQLFNALQQMVQFLDSTQEEYTFQYDHRNNLVWRKLPSKKVELFWYNEQNSLGSYTDTAGKTEFYHRDINDNITKFISAMGKITEYVNDLLTNQPTRQTNSDGSFLAWVLDNFGYTQNHTDLSGAVVTRQYNFLMQPTSIEGQGGNHGVQLVYVKKTGRLPNSWEWGTYYELSLIPTLPQNMRLGYREDGLLNQGVDLSLARRTTLGFDTEGRRTYFKAEREGAVIREISSVYDPMSRMLITYGTQEIVIQGYDATENIMYRKTTLYPPQGDPVVNEERNAFDQNDSATVYGGVLANGQTGIQPNKGTAYTSANGLRKTQTKQTADGTTVTETLTYNPDKLLGGSTSTDGSVTVRGYDNANRPNSWALTHPNAPHGNSEAQTATWDDDSNLTNASSTSVKWFNWPIIGWKSSTTQAFTTYGGLNAYGMPTSQQTIYTQTDQDNVTDNLALAYVNREQPEEATIGGTRTDSNGTSPYNAAYDYQGPNPGELTGQNQPLALWIIFKGKIPLFTSSYIEQDCLEGQILKRRDFDGLSGNFSGDLPLNLSNKMTDISFLTDISGNLVASVNVWRDLNNPGTYSIGTNYAMPGTKGILATRGKNPNVTTDFTIGEKMINPIDKSYPPMNAGIWDVKNGDTLESIAQATCGSTQAAGALSAANGGIDDQQLKNGNVIKIPQWIQQKYRVSTTEEFDQMITSMTQQLYPKLLTPQPKQDFGFFDEMLDVVILAVAVGVGNWAGTALMWTSWEAETAVAAVAGAVLDAAKQGIEYEAGMRDSFSWREVVQMSVESAFAEYSKLHPGGDLVDSMMKAGAIDVAQQLVLMALVKGSHFSLKEVLEQMGSAGIGYALQQKLMPNNGDGMSEAEKDIARTKINAGTIIYSGILRGVFEQRFDLNDIMSIMANFVGTELGQAIVDKINPEPKTQQSKINNKVSQNLGSHSSTRTLEDDITEFWDEIKEEVVGFVSFFDPSVTQPNAQPSAKTQTQQSQQQRKLSQAQAMARHGIYSKPVVLNHADANGYLGTGLGLPDDPTIDNFDPNSDGTLSGSGVSRAPTTQSSSSVIMQGLQELNNSSVVHGLAMMDVAMQAGATDILGMTHIGVSQMNFPEQASYAVGQMLGAIGFAASLPIDAPVALTAAMLDAGRNYVGSFFSAESAAELTLGKTSASMLQGTEKITPELVNAMNLKGRVVVVASQGSEDYKYLEAMNAEASTNTALPNHILIKYDANKSALLEEFLHGTQNKLGIVDELGPQGAEVHVKEFMLRHANMLGLNNPSDVKLLQQLHIEEINRLPEPRFVRNMP